MYFYHTDEVWHTFPCLSALVFTVRHAQVLANADLNYAIDPLLAEVASMQAEMPDAERPSIKAWRSAYATMGFKPTQYRSAVEALLRRYRKEGEMPHLHPLISLLNARSMLAGLPIAAFDIRHISGGIHVCSAKGHETFENFQGQTEVPTRGEIIFADESETAHSRRWVFRQSARSSVSSESDHILIVIEGMHDQVAYDLAHLRDILMPELIAFGAAPRNPEILTSERRRYEFDLNQ